MDNRRIFLALVLSFAVVFAWSLLFQPPARRAGTPTSAPRPSPAALASPTPLPSPGPPPESLPSEPLVGSEDREIHVRSALFHVVLTARGGVVKSWWLERYLATPPRPGETSQPVNLVAEAPSRFGLRPLALVTGQAELDTILGSALYVVEGQDAVLAPGQRARVAMRWADGAGNRIEKVFEFDGSSYVAVVEVTATLAGSRMPWVLVGPGMAPAAPTVQAGKYGGRTAVLQGGKVHYRLPAQVSAKRLRAAAGDSWPPQDPEWLRLLEAAGELARFEGVAWAGMDENYFAALAFAREPLGQVASIPIPPADLSEPPALAVGLPLRAGGARFSLYVGPKDKDVLEAVRPDLSRAIEFGFFESLARILLSALKFFHRYVGNWGLAIIVLTVVVKILFLPLTIKQLGMMEKMSRLRPKLKEIEDRYARALKDPKERLEASRAKNADVMALYQREGVNPASGCLPLLLQIPVFYGLYSILGVSIELRHAPFVLWIQDLSAKDPFYVTPVLMLISQIIQQAIMPTSADPMQRRLMFVMPVVFAWIFKDLASGLVLYWLTQNVLSIVQQVWMNRLTQRRASAAPKRGPSRRKK